MRCKYTKFLYSANECEIFFFNLTVSLLPCLLKNVKITQVLISLNDRFKTSKLLLNQALQLSFQLQQVKIIFTTIFSTYYKNSPQHSTHSHPKPTPIKKSSNPNNPLYSELIRSSHVAHALPHEEALIKLRDSIEKVGLSPQHFHYFS